MDIEEHEYFEEYFARQTAAMEELAAESERRLEVFLTETGILEKQQRILDEMRRDFHINRREQERRDRGIFLPEFVDE